MWEWWLQNNVLQEQILILAVGTIIASVHEMVMKISMELFKKQEVSETRCSSTGYVLCMWFSYSRPGRGWRNRKWGACWVENGHTFLTCLWQLTNSKVLQRSLSFQSINPRVVMYTNLLKIYNDQLHINWEKKTLKRHHKDRTWQHGRTPSLSFRVCQLLPSPFGGCRPFRHQTRQH